MSTDTYRSDLNAAQLRTRALETELRAARARIEALEAGGPRATGALRDLLEAGAREHDRRAMKARRKRRRQGRIDARYTRWDRAWKRWSKSRTQQRSLFFYPLFGRWLLSLGVVGFLTPFAAIFIIFAPARIAAAYALLALGVLYVAATLWGPWAMRRERKRHHSLPFAANGHFEALGDSDLRNPILRIHFEGSAPSRQEGQTLVLGLAKATRSPFAKRFLRETSVTRDASCLEFQCDSMEHSWHTDNRAYLLWYRQLVEKGAIALHDTYPIQSVHVGK